MSNLGNPKMAVFFASLLPQFAPGGSDAFLALLALGLLFCSLTFALAHALRGRGLEGPPLPRRPRAPGARRGRPGLVLVVFGARLAAESRS